MVDADSCVDLPLTVPQRDHSSVARVVLAAALLLRKFAVSDRLKKRASVKLYRTRERDFKQDMNDTEQRPESMPWPFPADGRMPAVPTLVESCNRFMCLTSRLKSRDNKEPEKPPDAVEDLRSYPEEELPESRVNFHKTFSMLINMGNNVEKGCRRTISREEQVWQNELKDLIWLELQAKVAGRTLAQQDAYLCSQRNAVPTILQNIMEYKFVNSNRCTSHLCAVEGSREDLADDGVDCTHCHDDDEANQPGCLSFNCSHCTDAIGKAMREISSLLDSFYSALELYPSSKAMTVEHPLIATSVFKNRLKVGKSFQSAGWLFRCGHFLFKFSCVQKGRIRFLARVDTECDGDYFNIIMRANVAHAAGLGLGRCLEKRSRVLVLGHTCRRQDNN
ncbi:unnamed protein product [Diatraea saccharalis]|uniref:Mitogen-activated protein kinase kinase kinase N-terminal domain-containing protein n=1 Tax=Diatraea saccharalis TaxID=40085 RepID=A0A9N9WCK3_9NEOP|nr:unnamed protein product [Diatraea saccharalis]